MCLEGRISRESVRASLSRGVRSAGDLVPWTVAQQFQEETFGELSGARVVRIATHPDAARMGYGSRALELLAAFYSGALVEADEAGGEGSDGAPASAPVKAAKRTRQEASAGEAAASAAPPAPVSVVAGAAPPRPLSSFRLSRETVAALGARGVTGLFPIQEATFDVLYDGKDVIGRARTGMGKTLAFVLPIVERLKLDAAASAVRGRHPRVIVMAPTRELAKQVADDFVSVQGAGLVTLVVYGGTGIASLTD